LETIETNETGADKTEHNFDKFTAAIQPLILFYFYICTAVQKFVFALLFKISILSSPRLHLFVTKYSKKKKSNIVK